MSKNFHFIILVVGLDGSGKTTLLEAFKQEPNKEKTILPTAGISIGSLDFQGKKIVYYDFSGDGRHRRQWANFYSEAHAILFVMDSTDEKRDEIVKEYIKEMFKEDVIAKREMPILIACNKQDAQGARDKNLIEEDLGLAKLEKRQEIRYYMLPTSGFDNKGLSDALEWLSDKVKVNAKKMKK